MAATKKSPAKLVDLDLVEPSEELTIDDVLARKKPKTEKFLLALDPDAAAVRDAARDALKKNQARVAVLEGMAGRGRDLNAAQLKELDDARSKTAGLEAELEAAEEVVAEESVTFVFKALGRKVVEVLMKKHRPTASQVAEFQEILEDQGLPKQTLQFNEDTFPPALLSACCVTPKMTTEEAQALWDSENFSRGDLSAMFQSAWNINQIISR